MLPHLELRDFAKRYTAAWCSQNPDSVAAFFSKDGSLRVNDHPPALGRHAISEVARSFMTAFPDLTVVMDDVVARADAAEFHWTLTGTNSGPGAAGRTVRISGFEEWRIGRDRLIASSYGHFDAADYRRQLQPETRLKSSSPPRTNAIRFRNDQALVGLDTPRRISLEYGDQLGAEWRILAQCAGHHAERASFR